MRLPARSLAPLTLAAALLAGAALATPPPVAPASEAVQASAQGALELRSRGRSGALKVVVL